MPFRKPLPFDLLPTFAVRDALISGVTEDQLRNPALSRPFRGARSLSPPSSTLERCRAYAPIMREGQLVSHLSAAELYDFPLPARLENGPLHISTPAPARATKAAGTVGHSMTLSPIDRGEIHGVPVTTPARTWCDLATRLSLGDLVAAADHLLCWTGPLVTRAQLAEAMLRHPSRIGREKRRRALQLASEFSQSRPESVIRVALVMSPLPDPVPNFPVHLSLSGRDIRIDLAYPRYLTGLEYQGDHHRSDRTQWRKDISRGNDATDAGWSMLYFTGDDLHDIPGLLARVERRLRSRGWPG